MVMPGRVASAQGRNLLGRTRDEVLDVEQFDEVIGLAPQLVRRHGRLRTHR